MTDTTRYPIAIATHRGGPMVACSDGTVWWWRSDLGEWQGIYPAVPGTPADIAADHAARGPAPTGED